jgi:hypothetical protein
VSILHTDAGATYTSKGMIFTILRFTKDEDGVTTAHCLVLDDNPKFIKRIPGGTVMEVEDWTSVWEEAMRIASPGERCKVTE